jgi:hypothetical protein
MTETLSTTGSPDAALQAPEVGYLTIALVADVAVPSRHRLAGITAVELGRGERRDARRRPPTLQLALPDPWLSGRHARFRPVLHRWAFEDLRSRNGSLLNGKRARSALLNDGDVIQVGHSFLVFRVGPRDSEPDDVDGVPLDDKQPGLATLSPVLGRELARLEQVA